MTCRHYDGSQNVGGLSWCTLTCYSHYACTTYQIQIFLRKASKCVEGKLAVSSTFDYSSYCQRRSDQSAICHTQGRSDQCPAPMSNMWSCDPDDMAQCSPVISNWSHWFSTLDLGPACQVQLIKLISSKQAITHLSNISKTRAAVDNQTMIWI